MASTRAAATFEEAFANRRKRRVLARASRGDQLPTSTRWAEKDAMRQASEPPSPIARAAARNAAPYKRAATRTERVRNSPSPRRQASPLPMRTRARCSQRSVASVSRATRARAAASARFFHNSSTIAASQFLADPARAFVARSCFGSAASRVPRWVIFAPTPKGRRWARCW